MRQHHRSFRQNERGGVAIFFGFALPMLLVGAGAALEYASLAQRRGQLQKAADTAALAAANELKIATAARIASTAAKICVVALDKTANGAIRLDSNARLTANGCAVYSNSTPSGSVCSESNAVLSSSALICSSGGFVGSSGNYSGRRLTDCPTTPDPMANRPPPPVEPYCQPIEKVEDNRRSIRAPTAKASSSELMQRWF